MESGTFFNAVQDVDFTGVEPVITSIVGTFDGEPITSGGGWMLGSFPGGIGFEAGGVNYTMWWDGVTFFDPVNDFSAEYINWSAVHVPEPPLFWLLLTALSLLGLMRWAQMSLRKLSGR
jgi:hypothetical protein